VGRYAEEAVERGDGKGAELSYGSFGDRILTHMRDHDTLQAALRFGRDGNGAVVYVHTDTLPEWVPTAGEGRVINTWSDGMKQVLAAAADLGDEFGTGAIADHDAVGVCERQALDHLKTLVDRGYLAGEIDGNGYTWRDDGIHRVSDHGEAELDTVDLERLDDEETRELSRSSVYTWEFRRSPPETPAEASGRGRPTGRAVRRRSSRPTPRGTGRLTHRKGGVFALAGERRNAFVRDHLRMS